MPNIAPAFLYYSLKYFANDDQNTPFNFNKHTTDEEIIRSLRLAISHSVEKINHQGPITFKEVLENIKKLKNSLSSFVPFTDQLISLLDTRQNLLIESNEDRTSYTDESKAQPPRSREINIHPGTDTSNHRKSSGGMSRTMSIFSWALSIDDELNYSTYIIHLINFFHTKISSNPTNDGLFSSQEISNFVQIHTKNNAKGKLEFSSKLLIIFEEIYAYSKKINFDQLPSFKDNTIWAVSFISIFINEFGSSIKNDSVIIDAIKAFDNILSKPELMFHENMPEDLYNRLVKFIPEFEGQQAKGRVLLEYLPTKSEFLEKLNETENHSTQKSSESKEHSEIPKTNNSTSSPLSPINSISDLIKFLTDTVEQLKDKKNVIEIKKAIMDALISFSKEHDVNPIYNILRRDPNSSEVNDDINEIIKKLSKNPALILSYSGGSNSVKIILDFIFESLGCSTDQCKELSDWCMKQYISLIANTEQQINEISVNNYKKQIVDFIQQMKNMDDNARDATWLNKFISTILIQQGLADPIKPVSKDPQIKKEKQKSPILHKIEEALKHIPFTTGMEYEKQAKSIYNKQNLQKTTEEISKKIKENIVFMIIEYALMLLVLCIGINLGIDLMLTINLKDYTRSQISAYGTLFTFLVATSIYVVDKLWNKIGHKVIKKFILPDPLPKKRPVKAFSFKTHVIEMRKKVKNGITYVKNKMLYGR